MTIRTIDLLRERLVALTCQVRTIKSSRSMRISLLVGLVACMSAPCGAQSPYVGYVYPAGGQQGAVFQVTVGGQRLRGVRDMCISGSGVRASVVDYQAASGPLNQLQQQELRRRLEEIRAARGVQPRANRASAKPPNGTTANAPAGANAVPVALPDLPELKNLEQKTPRQLQQLADKFLNNAKRPKPPIAEQVTLEITIEPNAAPGDRELRLQTPSGLSNPLVFQVGQVPETREPDKDDDIAAVVSAQPPVVLNGQIMPGEVDRFPLQLKGGQKLVIAVQARKLIPYLADAVPGWFQAVVSLYDSDGKEVAYANECGFDPDPAFVFEVPKDGGYTLAIRDAIYRGREDFVYRVDVGDESLIKSLFPLGSRGGVPIGADKADREVCAQLAQEHFQLAGNSALQCDETEPNDTVKTAMSVTLPRIVSGCMATPGDKDKFRIDGRAGQEVVAEVYARRMGSPLDSLLRLTDTSGRVVAFNDDHEDMESGLLTHQADSYLSAKLPANGAYFLQLSDAQHHGGSEYVYYLRIGPPQPDFALSLTPSSLNVPAGGVVTATVCASRKDGCDCVIEVALKDAPAGFLLSGGRIPKGRDKVRMTLTAPGGRSAQLVDIHLEGRAQIGGKTVTRPVVPADDMMQAFAYHHLVPSRQLAVMVMRGGGVSPSLDMAGDLLKIPSGGSAQASFRLSPLMANAPIHLELSDPPDGVTLQEVTVARGRATLVLKADDKHTGYADNLIVEAFAEMDVGGKKGAAEQKQRVSLGVLPAIPFEIVKP